MSSQGIQSWYIGIGNIPLLFLKAKIGQKGGEKERMPVREACRGGEWEAAATSQVGEDNCNEE